MKGASWTPEEDAWLREFYPLHPNAELVGMKPGTPRSMWSIQTRAARLGLAKADGCGGRHAKSLWTDERREWFVAFVPGHTEREISAEHERLFGFPLLHEIEGDYMDGAPEDGSAEAARRKGGESNRRRNDRRWGHIDESIGRAVNQCELDGVPATRQNVAERMTMDGQEVTKENVLRWTRNDASTKWRVRKDGSDWILFCTDESWSAKPQEM